jgi:hypothetical protein
MQGLIGKILVMARMWGSISKILDMANKITDILNKISVTHNNFPCITSQITKVKLTQTPINPLPNNLMFTLFGTTNLGRT